MMIITDFGRRENMWNNDLLKKKSTFQPIGLKIQRGHYILGDRYIKSLLVTELPRQFDLGLLSSYVSNPEIKVFMRTEPLDLDCAGMLKKEYNDKSREYQKSGNDPTRREILENELISLNTYIKEIVDNHDVTWNITIVFSVYADTEKEVNKRCQDLNLRLRAEGFKLTSAPVMQENLMRVASPLFVDSLLPAEVEKNIGIPLPSLGLAGLYPFVFETLKDRDGFLLGHELMNKGAILFDQFQWLDDPMSARALNRLSGNLVIVGGTGFGKSTLMKLLIRFYIRTHKKIIWIDPENKNNSLTKRYGGTFINWGRRGHIINVFDLKPISVEEDEDASVKWDTELAIYNCVDDVKIILRYLVPSISDDTLSIVGDQMVMLYADHGLTPDGFPWTSGFCISDLLRSRRTSAEEHRGVSEAAACRYEGAGAAAGSAAEDKATAQRMVDLLQWTYIAGSGGLIEGYHRVRYEDAAGEAADIDQCAESHHVPICLVVVSG